MTETEQLELPLFDPSLLAAMGMVLIPAPELDPLPTRLHAHEDHVDFHPYWSRRARVIVDGEFRRDIVWADTVTGAIEIYEDVRSPNGWSLKTIHLHADSVIFEPESPFRL